MDDKTLSLGLGFSPFWAFVSVFVVALGLVALGTSLAALRKADSQKGTPFECGFDPLGSGRFPFSLQFFLVAIFFLLFDLEIALLYPMAGLKVGFLSESSVVSSVSFLILVVCGLFHEWNEGSLHWKM